MNVGAKQKPVRFKDKIREESNRDSHVSLAIAVAILAAVIVISSCVINPMLNQPTDNSTFKSTAAIVDHLSLTRPNQTFIETVTNLLEEVGYTVDYYSGKEVTVSLYRNLLAYGYKLLIFRVHSSSYQMQGEEIVKSEVTLFTSEPYGTAKHLQEQLGEQVVPIKYLKEEQTLYFGIRPEFIMSHGKFNNTWIVMMGCDGLTTAGMARAFVKKGAIAYVGWYGSITGNRNDPAITRLLQHLVTERQTLRNAVTETMVEFGPNNIDYSFLKFYPNEAGDCTIQDLDSS